MKINLFVNYYMVDAEDRQKEIDFCFDQNLKNKHIDRVVIFSDRITRMLVHNAAGNGDLIPIDRPTYQDFFNVAKDYPNDINIIANSDIYFDETIELVKQMRDNEVYCLTRWEYNDGDIQPFFKIHGSPAEWSQDCVIWKGINRLKNVDKVWATNLITNQDEEIPYTLGYPGQENHMAWLLNSAGYNVSNPSTKIRAIHVHKDRNRPNYSHRIKGQKGGGTWGRLMKVQQT